MIKVPVKRLPHANAIDLPVRASRHAAGMDLSAAFPKETEWTIWPGGTAKIPTGLCFAIPHGFQGEVRSRSGLAAKYDLHVLNSPGTIDADYRGEVFILLHNAGRHARTIKGGERLAQIVFMPVVYAELSEVDELPSTERGLAGLGSTGVRELRQKPEVWFKTESTPGVDRPSDETEAIMPLVRDKTKERDMQPKDRSPGGGPIGEHDLD